MPYSYNTKVCHAIPPHFRYIHPPYHRSRYSSGVPVPDAWFDTIPTKKVTIDATLNIYIYASKRIATNLCVCCSFAFWSVRPLLPRRQ